MEKLGGISGTSAIVILLAIVVSGVFIWGVISLKEQGTEAAITDEKAQTETGVETITAKVSCPADQTTDGQIRYEDALASVFTQGNPTCYFTPKSEGLERVTAGTLSTSDYSTAVDLQCTTSGTKWRAICVTSAGAWSSADEGVDFTASGAYVKRDLKGKAIDELQVKVEDKYSGGATFLNETTCSGGTTNQGYQVLNGTSCAFADKAGNSALTLATDGYMDLRVYLKTNTTKKQFGEDGLRTWMLIDASAAELDEPIAGRDNGPTFVNALTSMQSEDLRKYSGYEYAYNIGPIGDRETVIDYYQESAAGVNPSTDPIIEFCAEGRYASTKQKDVITFGCWTDAATQTEVFSTLRQYFTLDIS